MADTVELTVPASMDGARADKVISEMLSVSRSRASDLASSFLLVDGTPAASSTRVGAGQVVTCAAPGAHAGLVPEEVGFDVLFEDDSVIVVGKPPGLVVHPGSGRTGATLAAGLLHRYPELAAVGPADRAGLVHRLDKDTSGALLVARTPEAHEALTAQLRRRHVTREYLALVEGAMDAPTGTIDAPIARDPSRPTRQAIDPTGRHARTHYEVVGRYEQAGLSLLRVRLETGRTHQIRVHMSAIGHPVVGDAVYGAAREPAVPRMFLHAARLGFDHPVTGERVVVEAPLPADLATVLDHLGPGA